MALTDEEKTKITQELEKKLKAKNRQLICPICTNQNFTLSEGYTLRMLNAKLDEISIGGLNIPSVTIICTHCGYALDFAIGVLGLLPKKEDDANDKK